MPFDFEENFLNEYLAREVIERGGVAAIRQAVRRHHEWSGGRLQPQTRPGLPPGEVRGEEGEHLPGQPGALQRPEIGGQAQRESTMGGIIILLTPAPIIDPFPAWKPAIIMP